MPGKVWREEPSTVEKLFMGVFLWLAVWLIATTVLQLWDPAIGVLDIGVLTMAVFGLLLGWISISVSLWLQEILWQPFKIFKQNFHVHFHQLTSWQQCILYFSVFFLLLYALLQGLKVIF